MIKNLKKWPRYQGVGDVWGAQRLPDTPKMYFCMRLPPPICKSFFLNRDFTNCNKVFYYYKPVLEAV